MPQRFCAAIAGDKVERWIDIEPAGAPGKFTVAIDGKPQLVDARRLEDGVWSIIIGDRSFEVDLDGGAPDVKLQVRGEPITVKLLDERARKIQEVAAKVATRPGGRGGAAEVTAPMPGRVVKVLTKVGDVVKANQGLLVVEAMKMENEMRATRDGTITAVQVKEGQPVEAGQVLVVIGD
jgi:biotin carboxyl carrier protein